MLRGHVMHNLHRFAEAEALARQLVAQRESPYDHGLLGDALMEQGQLDEAVEAYQRMADLKPGFHAYSRIAHVRWLRGDLEGARQVMYVAVRAASPRDFGIGGLGLLAVGVVRTASGSNRQGLAGDRSRISVSG